MKTTHIYLPRVLRTVLTSSYTIIITAISATAVDGVIKTREVWCSTYNGELQFGESMRQSIMIVMTTMQMMALPMSISGFCLCKYVCPKVMKTSMLQLSIAAVEARGELFPSSMLPCGSAVIARTRLVNVVSSELHPVLRDLLKQPQQRRHVEDSGP